MKCKTLYIIWCILVGVLPVRSQSHLDIDSLLTAHGNQTADTTKVKTANAIVNYYMYREPGKSRLYIADMIDLSNELDYARGKCLGYYQMGVYFNNQEKLDSAKYYYGLSLKIADQIRSPIYQSQALRGMAIIEFSQGNLLKADSINDIDLTSAIENKDSVGIALAYDFKGTINQNKGYYSIALKNVLKGLAIFEQLGDSVRIADGYNHVATLEYNLGNFQEALMYNQKALSIYEAYEDTSYQAQALNDIGIMYMRLGQYNDALHHYNKSLGLSRQHGYLATQVATLSNLGVLHLTFKEYDKAIDCLDQSIALAKSINAKRRIAISENKLAQVYLLKGAPKEAIKHAKRAKEYAETSQNISLESVASKHLSSGFEQLNEFPLALAYHKTFKTLSDSILNEEKINTIEELRIQFDTQQKEAEIALQSEEIKVLKIQAKNDQLTKMLFGSGMFSFLAIAGLLYFGFTQRIRKNKIARDKQEAIYKQEIEYKKKELASQTLHLIKKSTFIQELKENLEKIKQSPDLFKAQFRRLILLLERQSAEDQDWEVFKSYFSEVHNNFDDKLLSIADDITEKEMRLASFLRMKLTTKEIASILNVLPDSVLKSKYRLKKKLRLDKEQDLTGFLNTI